MGARWIGVAGVLMGLGWSGPDCGVFSQAKTGVWWSKGRENGGEKKGGERRRAERRSRVEAWWWVMGVAVLVIRVLCVFQG